MASTNSQNQLIFDKIPDFFEKEKKYGHLGYQPTLNK